MEGNLRRKIHDLEGEGKISPKKNCFASRIFHSSILCLSLSLFLILIFSLPPFLFSLFFLSQYPLFVFQAFAPGLLEKEIEWEEGQKGVAGKVDGNFLHPSLSHFVVEEWT